MGLLLAPLGTKGKPPRALKFTPHDGIDTLPKMLRISVEPDSRWFISFCAVRQYMPREGEALRSPQELAYELGLRGEEQGGKDWSWALTAVWRSRRYAGCPVGAHRAQEARHQRLADTYGPPATPNPLI